MEIAKGEFIGFCDPDDWIDLNFFEKLYFAAKTSNADIAAGNIIRIKNNKSQKFYVYNNVYSSCDYFEKIKICDIPTFSYAVNKIYKTSELRKSNLKFMEGVTFEDIIFSPQAVFYLKKLITITNANYYYFMRQNSTVHQKKYRNEYEKAIEIAKNFLKTKNIPIETLLPKTKKLKLFGITIARKTTHKQNPYAETKFDNKYKKI